MEKFTSSFGYSPNKTMKREIFDKTKWEIIEIGQRFVVVFLSFMEKNFRLIGVKSPLLSRLQIAENGSIISS